jgi:hypothetical protein
MQRYGAYRAFETGSLAVRKQVSIGPARKFREPPWRQLLNIGMQFRTIDLAPAGNPTDPRPE